MLSETIDSSGGFILHFIGNGVFRFRLSCRNFFGGYLCDSRFFQQQQSSNLTQANQVLVEEAKDFSLPQMSELNMALVDLLEQCRTNLMNVNSTQLDAVNTVS